MLKLNPPARIEKNRQRFVWGPPGRSHIDPQCGLVAYVLALGGLQEHIAQDPPSDQVLQIVVGTQPKGDVRQRGKGVANGGVPRMAPLLTSKALFPSHAV